MIEIFGKNYFLYFKNLFREISKKIFLIYHNKHKNIHYKKNKTPVTEADKISQELIYNFLIKTNISIISEEINNNPPLNSDYTWVIDPLDGTTDFIQKTGQFSVMIGLLKNNKPYSSFIYQPTENKLYFAEKNKGAFLYLNNVKKKLFITNKKDISSMTMIVSKNHFGDNDKKIAKLLHVKKIIHYGSVGLKIGLVIENKADFYINSSNKTHIWDSCAGNILTTEANGLITDLQGKQLQYNKNNFKHLNGIIVANKIRHPIIICRIQGIN